MALFLFFKMTRVNRFKTKGAHGAILLAASVVLGAGALGALSLGCSTEDEIQFGDPLCPANRCKDDVAGASSGGSVATTDCPGNGVLGPDCPSWKDDIFGPIVDTNGAGKCAAPGCHGVSGVEPLLVAGNAKDTRLALLNYDFKNPTGPYVSCVKPGDSKILCNLAQIGTCGSLMPKDVMPKLDETQIKLIEDWITCGAPDN